MRSRLMVLSLRLVRLVSLVSWSVAVVPVGAGCATGLRVHQMHRLSGFCGFRPSEWRYQPRDGM